MISEKPMMAFSGVRSSCDMLARNSLFMRLAAWMTRFCSTSCSYSRVRSCSRRASWVLASRRRWLASCTSFARCMTSASIWPARLRSIVVGLQLLVALLLQADELGHVLHPVDDARQIARRRDSTGLFIGLQNRSSNPPPSDCRPADVVLLHRHRVGGLAGQHPAQRRVQVPHAVGGGIVGVVGKHLEQVAPDDGLAPGQRRLQVGVADRQDGEVGRQDEVQPGKGLEQHPEVQHGPCYRTICVRPHGNGFYSVSGLAPDGGATICDGVRLVVPAVGRQLADHVAPGAVVPAREPDFRAGVGDRTQHHGPGAVPGPDGSEPGC